MKWRILISTISIPLIFALLAVYTIYADSDPYRVYRAILFLAVALARILLSDRKYLVNLTVTSSTLEIQYYTSFLVLHSQSLSIPEIKDLQLGETFWLSYHRGTLNISLENDYLRFLILHRQQFEQLRMSLATLNVT